MRSDLGPRWRIDDVLDRTDLSVLLDELTRPVGRFGPGRRWHCPVPGHDDLRASVTMFRDSRGHERWRCWSADHRGDAIDLVIAVTGRSRADAIDWLASRAGMAPDRPLPTIRPKATPRQPAPPAVPDPAVARYVEISHRLLASPHGEPVRHWLRRRGLSDATIDANRIGVDPGRTVIRRRRGLPYGAGTAAVFPAFDPLGNVTYVQARYLDPETTGRKYDNPSAALAPHPRIAFPAAMGERGGVLLVCEGLPDALTAAQAGFRSVALLGAHTPDDSVAARLANHATNLGLDISLLCDPDPAGRRVAETLAPLLAARGVEPTVLTPPLGLDVNDWALHDPSWADTLDHSLAVGDGVEVDL